MNSAEVKRIQVKQKRRETGKFPVWAKVLVAGLLCVVVAGGVVVFRTQSQKQQQQSEMGQGGKSQALMQNIIGKTPEEAEEILEKIEKVKAIKIIGKAGLDTYAGDVNIIANSVIETDAEVPELPEEDNSSPLILGNSLTINEPLVKIKDLGVDDKKVSLEGEVINSEDRELKSGRVLYSFDLYDGTSTLTCKAFLDKKNAKKVILEVADEFEKLTGRKYGLFEEYKLEDADVAIVCMNSTAGTAKFVVDDLRSKGIKAGLLKVRVFRPFPAEEIAKALANVKAVAVLDKADSLNAAGGALFTDVTSGMYVNNIHVPTVSYIYGIGGRDTKSDDIEKVYNDLLEIVKTGKIDNPYRHLGLRTKGAEK